MPLYERLKAALPEFGEVAAFSGSAWPISVWAAGQDPVARPLRFEFVTGNYFSTFGIRSFAGRLIAPSDEPAAATPAAVLSYYARQSIYARCNGRQCTIGQLGLISLARCSCP